MFEKTGKYVCFYLYGLKTNKINMIIWVFVLFLFYSSEPLALLSIYLIIVQAVVNFYHVTNYMKAKIIGALFDHQYLNLLPDGK